jgi:short-subunit dehydrogenase
LLEETDGVVVVTVSAAGKVALPLLSPYVAAKHGLRGFIRALDIELRARGSGVRVAMVHPGPVDTRFSVNVTSATGRLPPKPPLGYRPETVARVSRRALDRPRLEVTVGRAMRLAELAHALSGPLVGPVLGRVARGVLARGVPAEGPGGLWEPSREADPGPELSALEPHRLRSPRPEGRGAA